MAVAGIVLLFFIPLALLIGALILRAAISFANNRLGPPPELAYIAEDEDDWGDYPLPGQPERTTGVIPTPSVGSGMLMLLAVAVVNAVVTFVIQMALTGDLAGNNGRLRGPLGDVLLARLLNLPISFLLMSGLLAAMLPTSFGRSCLVTLFYFLICLGIAVVLVVPFFLLRVAG